jgi:hypothetical protein
MQSDAGPAAAVREGLPEPIRSTWSERRSIRAGHRADMASDEVEKDTLRPESEEVLMLSEVHPLVSNPTECKSRPTSELLIPAEAGSFMGDPVPNPQAHMISRLSASKSKGSIESEYSWIRTL